MERGRGKDGGFQIPDFRAGARAPNGEGTRQRMADFRFRISELGPEPEWRGDEANDGGFQIPGFQSWSPSPEWRGIWVPSAERRMLSAEPLV